MNTIRRNPVRRPERRPERRHGERGLSATEMLIAVAFLGIIVMAIPSISGTVQQQKANAVSRQFIGELRSAQSRAITTGWDFQLVGFPASATNGRANQYRILGRQGSTAWPALTAPTTDGTTTFAGPWIDLSTVAGGIDLNPNDSTGAAFSIVFDARGAVTSRTNFGPFQLSGHGDSTYSKDIAVSPVGRISIQ